MNSQQNANKQDLKKTELFLHRIEGLQFSWCLFSAMITLKIWQTEASGQEISWRGGVNLANTSAGRSCYGLLDFRHCNFRG